MVAQLVKWLHPSPEVCGLNPISDNVEQFSTKSNLGKTQMKEKEAVKGPFLKNVVLAKRRTRR